VVVAIGISLALKLFDYSKCRFGHKGVSRYHPGKLPQWLDAAGGGKSHSSRFRSSARNLL